MDTQSFLDCITLSVLFRVPDKRSPERLKLRCTTSSVSEVHSVVTVLITLWGDKFLLKRYLAYCSRTGLAETQAGYRRELRHFTRWRDRNHPYLHLREINAAFCPDWVSQLREQVRPD